jgi:hypothetical protein
MAWNMSGATIAPPGRIGMSSRIDQHTNVCGGMSLADVEGRREHQVEREGERRFGAPVLHVSQLVGEPGPTPVAPETRELLAALVLNIAACRRWLSADLPDIRQASATIERMKNDARALTRFISTSGHDSRA